MDNLQDHFDVPSIVDAFADSHVSICESGSTPNVILRIITRNDKIDSGNNVN